MKPLTIDTSQSLTRAGTLQLPVRAAVAAPHADDPDVPPQASGLSQWLLQATQQRQRPGSVADLLTLLGNLQRLFPEAVPELLAPLLHRLQPFVTQSRQVSDARQLRQQFQHGGLFLEALLADPAAMLPTVATDLKLQLFQLLALMDPTRQLTIAQQQPQFVDGETRSAQSLQGKGTSSAKALRGGRQVQAYLQCSHQDAEVGVSDGQLNPWLQQQVEDVLQQLVQQQLQCGQDGKDSHWQCELLLQQGRDVLGVPLELQVQQDSPPRWQVAFTITLPQLGKVGIAMRLAGNRVELDIESARVLSLATRQRHWRRLQEAFAAHNLVLTTLNHRLGRES